MKKSIVTAPVLDSVRTTVRDISNDILGMSRQYFLWKIAVTYAKAIFIIVFMVLIAMGIIVYHIYQTWDTWTLEKVLTMYP